MTDTLTADQCRRHNLRILEEYIQQQYDEIPISAILIRDDCRICFRFRDRIVPEGEIELISPTGIVHHGRECGYTECGHDATGPGWWWRT